MPRLIFGRPRNKLRYYEREIQEEDTGKMPVLLLFEKTGETPGKSKKKTQASACATLFNLQAVYFLKIGNGISLDHAFG